MTAKTPLKLIFVSMLAALTASISTAGTYKNKETSKDLVSVAAAADNFSTLVAAVKAADLVGVLQGEGPYTIFAPTNEAFAALPAGTLESLLKPENKDQLIAILTYHVVPAKVLAKDVAAGMVDTANGTKLTIAIDAGSVMVQDAKVVATDILASNGVIHVVDKVILPEA